MTRCPECGSRIAEPAHDGNGHVLPRPRYVRLTRDARIVIACRSCRAELEILAPDMRLRLFRRSEPTSDFSPPSVAGRPGS